MAAEDHIGPAFREQRLFGIEDESVVLPAIPEPARDLEELVRALAALITGKLLVPVDVSRLRLLERSHRVPGGASLRQMVQRGEGPRDRERLPTSSATAHVGPNAATPKALAAIDAARAS